MGRMIKRGKRRAVRHFRFPESGFTLLEIMISLAITGGLLVTVIYTLNYHLSLVEKQEFQTIATMLSKNRIIETEKDPVASQGEFPEPYSGYRYTTTISESPFNGISEITVTVHKGNESVKLSELIEIR
jgi:general secretion pathway protein I